MASDCGCGGKLAGLKAPRMGKSACGRVRVAAFGEPAQAHRACVDEDGTVKVWDSVAGHYTLHARLSTAQERRVARLLRSKR